MVKKAMFYKIRKLKDKGYNQSKIASELSLNRKTVRKYWRMSEHDFQAYRRELLYKDKVFDQYQEDILAIYKANGNRKVNMAAIYDYLEEMHGNLPGSERSLRNFVYYLIATNQLTFNENPRVYTKVAELPFGQQMQLDFGEFLCGSGLKLYIFAALLSASRFKFAVLQETPFKTKDVIQHLLTCFDYFGGIPREMVIDQDKLMVVSENKGDIIFTKDFNYLIDEMDLKMYVCRKADPESKGKIENYIGYIKHNFLEVRNFDNIQDANNSLTEWQIRRANGKISQATKRIPAEDIQEEREHLRPVRNSIFRKDSIIGREERTVSDKGYISVQACQYLIPSQYRDKTVEVYVTPHKLFVYDIYSGKEIALYELSLNPGKTLAKSEFKRENQRPLKEIKAEVLNLFSFPAWKQFLKMNFQKYDRYPRDQALDALKRYKDQEIDSFIFEKALEFCIQNQTISMSELDDTYRYYLEQHLEAKDMFPQVDTQSTQPVTVTKPPVDVKRRKFAIYRNIIKNKQAG